jgi:hypothetical protein
MQERYDKHVKDNEARKLTKEQKYIILFYIGVKK